MTPPMTNDLNPAGVDAPQSRAFTDEEIDAARAAGAGTYVASLPQPEGETADLVERLQPRWSVDEEVSHAVRSDSLAGRRNALSRFLEANNALKREAADAIASLSQRLAVAEAEIERLEVRLEIDHAFKLVNGELVRYVIPREERGSFPDGISARDMTIELVQERADAAEAQLAHAREAAIEECAKVADACRMDIDRNPHDFGNLDAGGIRASDKIAAAIRAMKGA